MLVLSKVSTLAPKSLAQYMPTVVAMLTQGASDSHPEVRKECCFCISLLRKSTASALKPFAKDLAKAFMPSLEHRLARVRLAAITAIGSLVLTQADDIILELVAWSEPNVIPIKDFFHDDNRTPRKNYLAVLATDPNPLVREAYLTMLADWMTKLTARYDHFGRLSPYILNGLLDEIDSVKQTTQSLLDAIGAKYFQEKQADFKDFLEYGQHSEAERNDVERWEALHHTVPFPLTCRPTLGARVFMQAQFRGLIGPITKEIVSWQSNIRTRALELLLMLIYYCEELPITGQLPAIFDALGKCGAMAITDGGEDPELHRQLDLVWKNGRALGMFVSPGAWVPVTRHIIESQAQLTPAPNMVPSLLHVCSGAVAGCSYARLDLNSMKLYGLVQAAVDSWPAQPALYIAMQNYFKAFVETLGTECVKDVCLFIIKGVQVSGGRCGKWRPELVDSENLSLFVAGKVMVEATWATVMNRFLGAVASLTSLGTNEDVSVASFFARGIQEDAGIFEDDAWAQLNAIRIMMARGGRLSESVPMELLAEAIDDVIDSGPNVDQLLGVCDAITSASSSTLLEHLPFPAKLANKLRESSSNVQPPLPLTTIAMVDKVCISLESALLS